MKSELRLARHTVLPGQQVVEIWHDGEFIGQVTGADGPGVRVLSKYDLSAKIEPGAVNVAEVRIVPRKGDVGAEMRK